MACAQALLLPVLKGIEAALQEPPRTSHTQAPLGLQVHDLYSGSGEPCTGSRSCRSHHGTSTAPSAGAPGLTCALQPWCALHWQQVLHWSHLAAPLGLQVHDMHSSSGAPRWVRTLHATQLREPAQHSLHPPRAALCTRALHGPLLGQAALEPGTLHSRPDTPCTEIKL